METVEQARTDGVSFERMGTNAAYGRSFKLLQGLDSKNEVVVVDVRKNRYTYLAF